MGLVREPVTWPRNANAAIVAWPGNPALGLILGTPCGSAIATGHGESVRGEGWGFAGVRCGGRGGGVRVRGSSFASAVFGLCRWRVWALRPPRHWSRDWYFIFLFFCATRGCGAGAGLGFTMLHCRLSLCADGWTKRGGVDKERGTGAVGGMAIWICSRMQRAKWEKLEDIKMDRFEMKVLQTPCYAPQRNRLAL